jgi:membrane protein implicated in regulation of membrane protease activity
MQLRREDIRRWAPWTGKLLLALVLITLLSTSIQFDTLASVFLKANPLYIGAALLLLPLNLYFQFRKWQLLVLSRIPLATARELRTSLLLGFTFGIVTPARIGEFGGRAAGIGTRSSQAVRSEESGPDGKTDLVIADKVALIGLTAIDKLSTMMVTLLMGACALLVFCWLHPFMSPWLLTGLLLFTAMGLLLLRLLWKSRHAKQGSESKDSTTEHRGYLRRRFEDVRSMLRALDTALLRRLLAFSFLFYCTFLLQFFLLLLAFTSVGTISALAGIGTIMLVKTIIPPVTIGELGIREAASVFVLGHAGILAAAAFNASLLLFTINILLPSLAGLLLLIRLPHAEAAS